MNIGTEGDVGDATVLMGIISQIPNGPHNLVLQKSQVTKMRDDAALAKFLEVIKPLAESQPYIASCRIETPGEHIDWRSGGFRNSGLHSRSATLFEAQLAHLMHAKNMGGGFNALKPWLTVTPSKLSKNRVVIARSGRYRNGYFHWEHIVKHYGDRLLFIGLPHEYNEFTGTFGLIEYQPTANMLEVAQIIAGSALFIGNQSSPMAVCEGLKHHSIQETALEPADCIYKRENAQYCYDGSMLLPDVDGSGEHYIITTIPGASRNFNTSIVPPGMWQFPGFPPSTHFNALKEMVARNKSITQDEAADLIIDHNSARLPTFFVSQEREHALIFVRTALANAGY